MEKKSLEMLENLSNFEPYEMKSHYFFNSSPLWGLLLGLYVDRNQLVWKKASQYCKFFSRFLSLSSPISLYLDICRNFSLSFANFRYLQIFVSMEFQHPEYSVHIWEANDYECNLTWPKRGKEKSSKMTIENWKCLMTRRFVWKHHLLSGEYNIGIFWTA